jgi:hypothetical protein
VIKIATVNDTTNITTNVEGEWKDEGEVQCKAAREDS